MSDKIRNIFCEPVREDKKNNYLRKAPLVRQITGMNEDVTLGQLDGAIVSVADTDDSCSSRRTRRIRGQTAHY